MAENIEQMLVVSDIDGTLLKAGCGVPEANMEAVEAFISRGGRFTVATGRTTQSVRNYLPWLPVSAPAVLCNGALIYDFETEKALYERTLDSPAKQLLLELLSEHPRLGIEIYKGKDIFVSRMNGFVFDHLRLEHMPYTVADFETLEEGWYKAVFCADSSDINMLSAFVDMRIVDDERYRRFTFTRSSDNCFEMVPSNVNKGAGLRKLAELLKTPMSDTVAIGDYYNDISMLDAAGYSAAVADAPPEVRAFADVSVKSCLLGGVAELLESLDSLCAGYEQMKFELDTEEE